MTPRSWEKWNDPVIVKALEDDWNKEPRTTLYRVIKETVEKHGLKTVLDAGCGIGHDYQYLKGLGLDYTGIDITPAMLTRAKELHPEGKFEEGDMFDLKFPDESFDLVLSNDILIHTPWLASGLRRLCQVSRKALVMKLAYVWEKETIGTQDPANGFYNITYGLKDVLDTLRAVGFQQEIQVIDVAEADRGNRTSPDLGKVFVAVKRVEVPECKT